MALFQNFRSWLGWGGALNEVVGTQSALPSVSLVPDTPSIGPDGALQISTVWACIDLRASTIASLPFFAYEQKDGEKVLARGSRLYSLLHESPNARHTPLEFWRAMVMNHDLRGNGYARIDRDSRGEAVALWPLPADQVESKVLPDGSMVYEYRIGADVAILSDKNVLHLKNLGNGTTGLAKLDFMRATTDEAAKSQHAASKVFGSGGKPTGVLMLDKVLNKEQRAALQASFAGMSEGNTSRLYILEANMKYSQLSMSPEDQQLLETRHFGVEEICRWFATPPVLVHHSNVTTWGSGIETILDGWYKLVIRPMLVSIEQATRKRVLTSGQRANMSVEISFDALLRGNPTQRAELYAKNVQNGIMTRNECRQLENLPPVVGAGVLTAQSNLVPLDMLGQAPANDGPKDPILQSACLPAPDTKADDRHAEVIQIFRAIANNPAPTISLTNSFADAVVNVTRNETITAPVVEVTNYVNPTPVEVNVTNEVNPANVECNPVFEATIQPATVELTLPKRKTVGTVERNDKGEIVRTETTESNA